MPDAVENDPHAIIQAIREAAAEEGFVACGIAPAIDSQGFPDLVRWIDAGYHAEMEYFPNRLDAYRNPKGVLPGAKSVVALAWPYSALEHEHESTQTSVAGRNGQDGEAVVGGKVARYTWQATDYHDVIHPKLKRICKTILRLCPAANARGIVDTAPLMEREFAQLAGLGWRGKNTLLLNKTLGSYFFLACVLVDVELPPDTPHESDHCGTCTACLDACPTGAFVGPHVLDASRCISYLTIESREMIPEPLREGIGDWLFGCDVCQEVCPWNRKPTKRAMSNESVLQSDWRLSPDTPRGLMELSTLFQLDEETFRARFRKSPMWRTRRRGLLRNAAIVLGNVGNIEHADALILGMRDAEPIVRASSVWAGKRILAKSPSDARSGILANELKRLAIDEQNEIVRAELPS
ncbi:tRNA epoxyqueuosine(34) reductase QueG [Rhodopirellula sallentina]|uniref:Iron-sulfur cluster-binding protein n=1 Tax=Rhodopirellula sallentina SM41 TaxID=1263870 RepID=M5TY92_9BACT|nr:tRNA epoxyqueuosine(34) reductase QueG [Rhodopirellula sallentina]EMI54004.1 iron-sulfur cluster-binding protein [Rhodopirellula sallentina SM41]